ncbi:iron response transcriptional regulator IrrA [Aestuariivirga sp.]|jgi:Fur family iron response transcriptional regulator|uniref:iron response transcriptional regulator IrrA n=1 Tax=Aestuariivirga sp. TaxID=2650926 RepID=UPI0037848E4D
MDLTPKKLADRLRLAGLRPTRQRLALATILFGSGDRHVSAESLHQEALSAEIGVSLATVYNTLNQFKAAGLLREVAFEGHTTFFDTNTSNHFHYFIEETGSLVDIGTTGIELKGLPQLPPATEIDRVDIIIRLRKTTDKTA